MYFSCSQSAHDGFSSLQVMFCSILGCHRHLRVRAASPHGFLQGHFSITDCREPELSYYTWFWSSDSINSASKWVLVAPQPPYSTIWWEPCNRWLRATASDCLFGCQAFQRNSSANHFQAPCLDFTITFGLFYFQPDFFVVLHPEKNARQTSYLVILLSWCFDSNVSAAHCQNVHSETKYLQVLVCLAVFLWHPAQMEEF